MKDEFREVANAFNDMAASLNEQLHQMQRAEQMNMVGVMAAGLVHEIKNPLAGIKAQCRFFWRALSYGRTAPDSLQGRWRSPKGRIFAEGPARLCQAAHTAVFSVSLNDILEMTIMSPLPQSYLLLNRQMP